MFKLLIAFFFVFMSQASVSATAYRYTLTGQMSAPSAQSSSFVQNDPFALSFTINSCGKEIPLEKQEVVQFFSAFINTFYDMDFRLLPGALGTYAGARATGAGGVFAADNKTDGQDTIDFRMYSYSPGADFDSVDGAAVEVVNFQTVYYENTFSVNKKNGKDADVLFGDLFRWKQMPQPDYVIFNLVSSGGAGAAWGYVSGMTAELIAGADKGKKCSD